MDQFGLVAGWSKHRDSSSHECRLGYLSCSRGRRAGTEAAHNLLGKFRGRGDKLVTGWQIHCILRRCFFGGKTKNSAFLVGNIRKHPDSPR